MVYAPEINGKPYTYGVSGLLYQRNLLLYDRETYSLWSQLGGVAVAGPLAGTRLQMLPVTETTWGRWEGLHPGTLVLSFQTGYQRDYSRDPYASWPLDRRPALVVVVGREAGIYPFSELEKVGGSVGDELGGRAINIRYDAGSRSAQARAADSQPLAQFVAFLADARAFYPRAPVYSHKAGRK